MEYQSEAVTLKLEGRIAGPWVSELNRSWQGLAPSLGSKRLLLDLRGVTFVDSGGRQLLANIHDQSDNHFLADSPLTKSLAEEAMGKRKNMKGHKQ